MYEIRFFTFLVMRCNIQFAWQAPHVSESGLWVTLQILEALYRTAERILKILNEASKRMCTLEKTFFESRESVLSIDTQSHSNRTVS